MAVRGLDVTDHDAVFRVFRELRDELGGLDRIVVNAGLGKGQPLGTGYFAANRQTAETNFAAALAQCEAAMEIFREQGAGHLVVISSMSALRGMPRNLTTYAASKAGVAAPAEGIRADRFGTGITVTTLFPATSGRRRTPGWGRHRCWSTAGPGCGRWCGRPSASAPAPTPRPGRGPR
ncbi:NADP-dependent 3-hydroxy acid dehydrogenase YdfG [Amycolatopsis viridis]|uniref:NADP-dependent 3-hydroxy acid dehydrogenase YdfG n=1 Tax=Amycolatopsis viridis TaxID=185678 RepID=A0ABX0SS74_9PSEU|nr:NADP-dependent 3-hydroxy acid dehydrogenase YdfG [Amycolatopsis viridis]